MDNAFQYTCELGMTEELSIQKEEIDEYITRKYAAKMISIFAIQELGKRPDEERECEFSDIKNQPKELQGFIKLSCEL
ncbi:hypothetical protein KKG31_02955 [Patescibacteria group bacterium]|nr:hypothetical protein [Patescibacteria group bacterium]MBU1758120.1 hypothetical protein [Patescibacteria group bacterium]